MRIRTLIVTICVAFAQRTEASAQEPGQEPFVRPLDPEDLSAAEWNEEEADRHLERVNELLANPVDLNTASYAELLGVPGFDREVAGRILKYREANRLRTVDDLLKLEGSSREILDRAAPFVTVRSEDSLVRAVRLSGRVRSRAEAVLREAPAAQETDWAERWKLVHRVMLECDHLVAGQAIAKLGAGLVVEKDPGEQRLADHIGGFLGLSIWQRRLELVLGDFDLDGGMALAFGSRGPVGKSSDVLGPSRWKGLSLRGRASSSESGGFRGIAVAYRTEPLAAAMFYSNRALHARLNESSMVTSFYEAGLFRTPAEESLRFRTRERVLGLCVSGRLAQGVRLGASASESTFLHGLESRRAGPQGIRRFALFSVDALAELGRLSVASEVAWDAAGNRAANLAIEARISRTVDAVVFVRSVRPEFVSLHGYGFADRPGMPAGESGVYLGLRCKVLPQLAVGAFVDQFERPSSQPAAFPITGSDLLAYVHASPTSSLQVELTARRRITAGGSAGTDAFGRSVATDAENSRSIFRVSLVYAPSAEVRLKSRYEALEVRPGSVNVADRGFAMTHEVSWSLWPWLACGLRAASFETDSYAARLYGWERTVRGAMAPRILSGTGLRWSASARLSAGGSLSAEAIYTQMSRLETGQPNGRLAPMRSIRSHFSAQLEVRF